MEDHEFRNELFKYFKIVISSNKSVTHMVEIEHHLKKISPEKQWDEKEVIFKAREIINEFMNNNLLMWGYGNSMGETVPWLTVTNFGKRCIEEENILPYDPEGYINALIQQVPSIDAITLEYLKESIQTYNKNCLLSSNITLGTASENIINNLIETFTNAISDAGRKADFERRTNTWIIYTRYKEFINEFNTVKSTLPHELKKDVEVYLDGMFNFIRLNRNQAGHPTGKRLNKKIIYSNIQIFSEYSQRIFDLIDYFNNNSII